MFCKKCKNSMYFQALSKGECEKCGGVVDSSHTPAETVCEICSEEYGICEQCGKEVNHE